MRVFLGTIIGLTALAATAIRAVSVASNEHSSDGSQETPAENVTKSQWHDHLLRTNFLRYRARKECDQIVNDRDLRNHSIRSFDIYEPFRPRSPNSRSGAR